MAFMQIIEFRTTDIDSARRVNDEWWRATEGKRTVRRELLAHERWLWTFVDVEGVEPTNNAGERAERQEVLWRKTSGGTDSPQGSRFVERVLTVVRTCQQQGKNILDYLAACIRAWRHGRAPPPLLAAGL